MKFNLNNISGFAFWGFALFIGFQARGLIEENPLFALLTLIVALLIYLSGWAFMIFDEIKKIGKKE